MARRSGRRPGKQDTRETILRSAREAFAERGYDGTSIRQIATSAGVDPALVHHYFGTKEELFTVTVQMPIDLPEMVPKLLADGIDGLPEQLVRTFLASWEHPATGAALAAVLRSAVGNRRTARLTAEFFATQVLRRLAAELGTTMDPVEARLRGSLVASQMFGLAVTRYVLRLEPLANASHEEVVAAVAPTLRRYLTGEITPNDSDEAQASGPGTS